VRHNRRSLAGFFWFCLAAVFIIAPGCVALSDSGNLTGRTCVLAPDFAEGGRLSIFLRLDRPDVPRLQLKIAAIEILDGATWIPLSGGAVTVDTGSLGRGQILVGRRRIPAGTCKSLRFNLVEAERIKKDGSRVKLSIEQPTSVIPLSNPIELGLDTSESLFASWDVERSLRGDVLLPPVLSVASSKTLPLVADLAYVSCPNIDTVYMFRTDRNWVHGSIGVPGEPRQLALDEANGKLYILASKAGQILVVDTKSNRVIDRIGLSMLQEPSFMAIDSNGANAFVIDGRGNYLARYDLASGNLAGRARIGQKMNYALYLPDHERVAVASSLDQAVYLVNPEDLAVQQEIPVNGEPQGLAIDGDTLYIAEESSNTVAVYDLAARKLLNRVRVGFAPYRIMVANGEVFVSNRDSGSVSLFRTGQIYAARTLKGAAVPTELAESARNHWLYIADANCGGVRVFDATSKLVAGLVDLQAAPGDIVVLH